MILKGNQRANGRELALHLMNVEDNEHVRVHDLRGFLADDLLGAFKEAEAISLGTKCQQYLFSLSLNPPMTANVPVEEFERVIGEIERRKGLSGQPRAIVFHEKLGRRHAHCVWSRIDVASMRAINLPHFKRRLMDIARELYLEHGWEMPAGFERPEDRNPTAYDHAEAGQAKRARRDPEALKALFQACWAGSDSRAGFAAALWAEGYCLARGDRRGFVAVDSQGEVYSLSRWCGKKTKELRARLGNHDDLPTVEAAMAMLSVSDVPPQEIDPSAQVTNETEKQKDQLAALVARQRDERAQLTQAQEDRRVAELKARQENLPVGMKAVWLKLTGQYDRILRDFDLQAQASATRDRTQTQALIDRHLSERRAFERDRNRVYLQQILEQEFASRQRTRAKYPADPMQPLRLPPDPAPFTVASLLAKPDLILEHLSEKHASFARNDILRALAELIDDPLTLRVTSERALASPELVKLDNIPQRFTTKAFKAVEQQLFETAGEMASLGNFRVKSRQIDKAIAEENARLQKRAGAHLSDEQINAIHHILAPAQLSVVVGLAGAGKSTLLNAARSAWERQGYRVHGAALAGKAADSLQSASGIQSRTLASLETSWKSGYEPVGTGDIVVIDEAGMVGTRQMARVAEGLRQRGCKLVLVGDPDQLQPIEAGTPFNDIVETYDAVRLTEIRRQASEWQRQASRDLADGNTEKALTAYSDHGAVHNDQSREHVIAALVDDYMADWQDKPKSSRLALAHRRKDVHAINQAIKSARRANSETKTETLFDTDHGPRSFAPGDRLLFTRNDTTLNVRHGMLGTVKKVGDGQIIVALDQNDTGTARALTFMPKTFTAIDHGFAVSIHRSQGCTVDRSFVLDSRTMDTNLTYVALTRHQEETALYTAPEIERKQTDRRRTIFGPTGFRTKLPMRSR